MNLGDLLCPLEMCAQLRLVTADTNRVFLFPGTVYVLLAGLKIVQLAIAFELQSTCSLGSYNVLCLSDLLDLNIRYVDWLRTWTLKVQKVRMVSMGLQVPTQESVCILLRSRTQRCCALLNFYRAVIESFHNQREQLRAWYVHELWLLNQTRKLLDLVRNALESFDSHDFFTPYWESLLGTTWSLREHLHHRVLCGHRSWSSKTLELEEQERRAQTRVLELRTEFQRWEEDATACSNVESAAWHAVWEQFVRRAHTW